jgi:hypothetical protein
VAPGWMDPYTVGAPLPRVANDDVDDRMNTMSCRFATSRLCAVWHRVDGSLSTAVASLHSGVESPYTVACPLRVTSRSALYYRRPTVSISCTHLMLAICHIWLVLYAFNVVPAPRA